MPGQMGNQRTTTQNLIVVDVRPEQNLLLVRGAVPGPKNGLVEIRKGIKA
jgi:large subunit ribosomal protein L3